MSDNTNTTKITTRDTGMSTATEDTTVIVTTMGMDMEEDDITMVGTERKYYGGIGYANSNYKNKYGGMQNNNCS